MEAEKAKRKEDRKVTLEKLKALGASQVHWEYDGSGDDGNIAQIQCLHGEEWKPIESDKLYEEVADIGYGTLGDHHGGWMDGDGSFGEMTWDLDTDKIKIEHNINEMTSSEHVTEDA